MSMKLAETTESTIPKAPISEAVRQCAAEGMVASQIAAHLGVSRQRIYQVAKANNITLKRADFDWPSREKRTSAPRIIIEASNVTQNQLSVGAVSELMAAADLIARGWNVYMPVRKNRGHDLIAYKGDTMITIEVRSGRKGACSQTVFYSKTHSRMKSSHYAIVVAGEPIQYNPTLPDTPCE